MTVRGADGNLVQTAGVGEAFLRDPISKSFRKLRVIVTKKGESFLVGLKDLKNLKLIDSDFPRFLGTEEERRSTPQIDNIHTPQPDNLPENKKSGESVEHIYRVNVTHSDIHEI